MNKLCNSLILNRNKCKYFGINSLVRLIIYWALFVSVVKVILLYPARRAASIIVMTDW